MILKSGLNMKQDLSERKKKLNEQHVEDVLVAIIKFYRGKRKLLDDEIQKYEGILEDIESGNINKQTDLDAIKREAAVTLFANQADD